MNKSPQQILKDGQRRVGWHCWYMVVLGLGFVFTGALLEPENSQLVTVAFYTPIIFFALAIGLLLRADRAASAGWLMTILFFLIGIASVLVVGGLKTNSATSFIVCIMIAAAVVGRQAASVFSVLSVIAITALAGMQAWNLMPAALSPGETLFNAWSAAVLPLAFGAYLLHLTLDLRQEALDAAAAREEERDTAQQDLIQSQKLEVVGRLVSGIAHDFNNLLTVILSGASLLKANGKYDENITDAIYQAGSRAGLLTTRLLAFGRPKGSEPVVVDIQHTLDDLVPLLGRLVGDEIEIALLTGPSEHQNDIVIDPIAFEQIVLNLVINAKEAIEERLHGKLPARSNGLDTHPGKAGLIELIITRAHDQINLTVRDNGTGIDQATQQQIFTPFFTTKASGTGLGLATVAQLSKLSGAQISVTSSPRGGAEFCLQWPAANAEPHATAQPAKAGTDAPSGNKLLLVEDNDLVRHATSEALLARGFEVSTAKDGLEAINIFEGASCRNSTPFDLVITDYAMHGLNGLQLTAALRSKVPDLPILLISGNLTSETSTQQFDTLPPGVLYLAKPFDQQRLCQVVAEALNGGQPAGRDAAATRPQVA